MRRMRIAIVTDAWKPQINGKEEKPMKIKHIMTLALTGALMAGGAHADLVIPDLSY